MTKSKLKIFAFFALLSSLSLNCAIAQESSSDAVFKKMTREYTLKSDGSTEFHYSHTLKYLTYFSIHNLYGEDFIVYNPQYQKLKINKSVTAMADGKLVESPENALNEVLPGFAANAPSYNKLREMVVTHTGLERGAIVDFDYTVFSDKSFSEFLMGNEVLWMSAPVEELKFVIHVPKKVKLNFRQYNIPEKPLVTTDGIFSTYTWILRNVPAATHEEFRLREMQNRPRVVFSTARNIGKLMEGFLAQDAFKLEGSPLLQQKVERISADAAGNKIRRIMAIQDLVANDINYQPVPLSNAAYRVRSAAEVYASNGGSEIEKAVLMATMLKLAGFQAEPVAVFPDRYFDAGSSNLLLVDRYLVKVQQMPTESGVLYLSPLQNDYYDQNWLLKGKHLLSLSKGMNAATPKPDLTSNVIEANCEFKLDKEFKLTGKASLELSGRLNPYLKLSQDSSYSLRLIPSLFESREVEKSSILRLDPEKSMLEYSLASSDHLREQQGHYFLKIQGLSGGFDGWHMNELVTARTEPLEIPFPLKESYHFSITLPDGFELITAESRLTLSKDFGKIEISISQEGNKLFIDRSLELQKAVIEPAEYESFKTFINTWNNHKYRELVIRIGPK